MLSKPAQVTKPRCINLNDGLNLISHNLMKPLPDDPFDRVAISQHLDNALFTSSRTMTGQNNTISTSLKICHNKFSYKTNVKN